VYAGAAAVVLAVGAAAGFYADWFNPSAGQRAAVQAQETKPPAVVADTPPPAAPVAPAPPPGPRTLLRLAGSNTMGPDLVPALVEAFLGARGASDLARSEPSPDRIRITAKLAGEPVQVEIEAKGTATGFPKLLTGEADIADASRPILPEEEARLHGIGVARALGSEHVVALDGIAVMVHRTNLIPYLTVTNLRRLFLGQANWSDLSWPAGQVKLFARDKNSGTWQVFCETVLLNNCTLPAVPDGERYEDSRKLVSDLGKEPAGIGFAALPFAEDGKAVVRTLPIAAAGDRWVPPTAFTIRMETYPLMRRLYMYVPESHSKEAGDFLAFVQSTTGQRVVASRGFVALDATPRDLPDLDGFAPRYRDLFHTIGQFSPVEVAIRFKSASSEIDPYGLTAIADMMGKIEDRRWTAKRMLVIGHSDNKGAKADKCDLSLRRAETVEAMLRHEIETRHLALQLLRPEGFCDDAPVTFDTTEEGLSRNRRAEVWIQR
jgi:phosphate transport system substrate-binding protein